MPSPIASPLFRPNFPLPNWSKAAPPRLGFSLSDPFSPLFLTAFLFRSLSLFEFFGFTAQPPCSLFSLPHLFCPPSQAVSLFQGHLGFRCTRVFLFLLLSPFFSLPRLSPSEPFPYVRVSKITLPSIVTPFLGNLFTHAPALILSPPFP